MQRNWIGRSEGAEAVFRCEELGIDFPVFTTRPDTLFGATFFVLAPEHPELERLVAGTDAEDDGPRVRRRGDARVGIEERGAEDRARRPACRSGRTVTNPVNGERIPMFVADYVLMEYGTGAIMAVPAHDQRDFEFAQAFDLEIRRVVEPADGEAARATSAYRRAHRGRAARQLRPVHGLTRRRGDREDHRVARGAGAGQAPPSTTGSATGCVSRQRYWGCPIPVVYCDECGIVPVPDDQLPVVLPDVEDYAPEGQEPARRGRGLGRDRVPAVRRPGPPRDRHDGHLRRLVLVLPPLPRPAQRDRRRSTARSPTTGCPSTSTSAASSTRSCT